MAHQLNERERRVLEAVIQSYVETAEPAGSVSARMGDYFAIFDTRRSGVTSM